METTSKVLRAVRDNGRARGRRTGQKCGLDYRCRELVSSTIAKVQQGRQIRGPKVVVKFRDFPPRPAQHGAFWASEFRIHSLCCFDELTEANNVVDNLGHVFDER